MKKALLLIIILIAPVVYYFEVERQGRWDITHITDWISENLSSGTTGYQ